MVTVECYFVGYFETRVSVTVLAYSTPFGN